MPGPGSDKVCNAERMTNDTSSLLKRRLVYMLIQDELRLREQAIHQIKLIDATGRLVAVTSYCLKYTLNLLARINYQKDNGLLIKSQVWSWQADSVNMM